MTINVSDFRIREGEKVKLEKWPTLAEPIYKSKKMYHTLLEQQVEQMISQTFYITRPTAMRRC